MPTTHSRRDFLVSSARTALAFPAAALATTLARPASVLAAAARVPIPPSADPFSLAARFSDLRRHFIFEFYPWYGGPPDYLHWDYLDRHPPTDLSSNYVPRLGAYDTRARNVLEQQARWIADAGVGAIALSWWGPGHYTDVPVHDIMDVMRDYGIKVTFALEPYRGDRGQFLAKDVRYLLKEYGDNRRYDALLILRNEDGREGPVFKGFELIVPPTSTDCHGVTHPVDDYTADSVWAAQTDRLREDLRKDFDHVTLLADSLNWERTRRSGFDGIGIYDNRIPPEAYAGYAAGASAADLVFSFNVNPGFDMIVARAVEPDSCYSPPAFVPPIPTPIDWTRADERERAVSISKQRITSSFEATLRAQTDPALVNVRRGFFLTYINSFNEWHEGHAFEPMKDASQLTAAERALGYHNPEDGGYRLATLAGLLRPVLDRRPSLVG